MAAIQSSSILPVSRWPLQEKRRKLYRQISICKDYPIYATKYRFSEIDARIFIALKSAHTVRKYKISTK